MIRIKDLTVKNFLSVGNVTQALNFNRKDLTLVLGENLDLGGDDAGARNGTGKTTILNALSYALFGHALTDIKKDNLINKTNGKNMLVTLHFECDGKEFRIERGRKPGIMKFFANDVEQQSEDDNSQGDSRETQAEVERMLGLSHDMFKHIVALNTYTQPFLSLKLHEQRAIIEQLLGITQLSDKSEKLKDQIKTTKEIILAEEHKIRANQEANNRIQEQIDSLIRRQKLWQSKWESDVSSLEKSVAELSQLDIESELINHESLLVWQTKNTEKTAAEQSLAKLLKQLDKFEKRLIELNNDMQKLNDHKCHACGQEIHDAQYSEIADRKMTEVGKIGDEVIATGNQINDLRRELYQIGELGKAPEVYYDRMVDAHNHRSSLENSVSQLANKQSEHDPYKDQIEEMKSKGLAEIDFAQINTLNLMLEHQEFLLKLLTNKDSFIRKKIIDQNLTYLNARLSFYLDKIGLPHNVKFLNDMTVEITEFGRDLDFDNLSRGERNRLILSLCWAFRDVWESLYKPINLLFVDEMIDNGTDAVGVENALAILKKMAREANKSIWLVSHRDELIGRVNNVLKVVKENGFTNYSTDVEVS